MSYKLEAFDVMEIVEDYIGVNDGYLGNFSYRTHREFYKIYCGLDGIEPDDIPGTTRERFIHILSTSTESIQLKILSGILKKYPFEKMNPNEKSKKKDIYNKILDHIKRITVGSNSMDSLKISSLTQIDTAFEVYCAKRIIGEGGSGRVFLVEDSKQNKHAIKFLNPSRITSQKLKRFKNEVFYSLNVNHPNIVQASDFGFVVVEGNKYPFYVMPYMKKTFKDVLLEASNPAEKLFRMNCLFDALDFAHSSSTWHRDLKPENVLYSEVNDKLVLSDFGIAHITEDLCRTQIETKDSSRLANFKYASPEQRVSGKLIDHRSDIYSLGLMINEIFTGEVPWGTGYTKIGDVVSSFSFLDPIVDKMIHQNPLKRIQSIKELKSQLGLL